MKITKEWLSAAVVRAIRTFAQTALGFITIGAAISDINWGMVASVAAVAAAYSLLTSIATGLPEAEVAKKAGTLLIDTSDPDKNIYRFDWEVDPESVTSMSSVLMTVNKNANLSQK